MLRITPAPPSVVSSSSSSKALEQQPPKKICRSALEQNKVAAATTSIDEIQDSDVVFGRGGFSYSHKGNRLFRRLVSHNHELYHSTNNSFHRQAVATSIVRAIHRTGGRFVKKDNGTKNRDKREGRNPPSYSWVSVTDKDACLKTCQALRDANIRAKRCTGGSKTGTATAATVNTATPCSSCDSSVVGPPSCHDQKLQELDLHDIAQTEETKDDESCFNTSLEPTKLVPAVSTSSLTSSSTPPLLNQNTSFDFHGNESFQLVPHGGHLVTDDVANSNVDVCDIDVETAKVLIESLTPPHQHQHRNCIRSSPYRSSLIGIEQFHQQNSLDYEELRPSFSSNPSSSLMSGVIKEIEDEFLHVSTPRDDGHPKDQHHFNKNNDSRGIFKRSWSSVTSIALVDALLLSEFENDL